MSTLPASFPVAPKPAPAVKPLDLAIVGMGCLFPKADNLGGYWANIKPPSLAAAGFMAVRSMPG